MLDMKMFLLVIFNHGNQNPVWILHLCITLSVPTQKVNRGMMTDNGCHMSDNWPIKGACHL